jgi:uncharacterized membrane protein
VRAVTQFVKTTVVGGALFLVPLVVILVILQHAVRLALIPLKPVAGFFPAHPIMGVASTTLVAIVGVIVLCFVAGLVARTMVGRTLGDQLEQLILRRVPGYTFLKAIGRGFAGIEGEHGVSVALARIEDAWVLSFVLERHASGLYTVFVPSAPTPAAGSVYYLTEDRLRMLDVPVTEAMSCVMSLGMGSRELLEGARGRPA